MALHPADKVMLLAGAASAALFGWTVAGFRRPISALLPNATLPDVAIGDHARETVAVFFARLPENPDAAALFNNMLTGPDLYFPLVFAAFLFLLLLRVSFGAQMFNRPVAGPLKAVVLAQPLLYGLADYAENATFLALMGDPAETLLTLAPWLTACKFVGVSLSAILILRFALMRRFPPAA